MEAFSDGVIAIIITIMVLELKMPEGADWAALRHSVPSLLTYALSFAFAGIVRGREEVWTMGMHVLGLCDVLMKRSDIEIEGFDIVEVIRYLARGDKPVDDGHVIADLDGPRFRAIKQQCEEKHPGSPMYNPFGRLKLVSMRDIAETN